MKKRILSLGMAICLLVCAIPMMSVHAASSATISYTVEKNWAVNTDGYEHVQDLGYGDYKLIRSSGINLSTATPNLDDGPYYLMMGMSGYQTTWAQIYIGAGTARNPNWYEAGDMRIIFPRAGGKITISNDSTKNSYDPDAISTSGVLFVPHTAYVFKFAKEKNASGVDCLRVYCNGVMLYESVVALKAFSKTSICFFTNGNYTGNDGSVDDFAKYPLLFNPVLGMQEDPDNYLVSATGLGLASGYTDADDYTKNILAENFWTLYDNKGYAMAYIDSTDGNTWDVKESATFNMDNTNHQFELTFSQANVSGGYARICMYGATTKRECIFNHPGWGQNLALDPGTGNLLWQHNASNTITLVSANEWAHVSGEKRLRMVLSDANTVKIYANDVLVKTYTKAVGADAAGTTYTAEAIGSFFTFMGDTTLRVGMMGHRATQPRVVRMKINNGTTAAGMVSVNMKTGASVRWDDPAGIRFETTVSGLSSLPTDAQVEIGTLILPKSYLDDVSRFTKEALDAAGKLYVDVKQMVWSSAPTEINDYYLMKAALVNIKEKNYAVNFAARSYVKITLADGTVDYVYSDFDATNNVRSVAQVAYAIQQDTAVYEGLSTERKANVDKYAAAFVA